MPMITASNMLADMIGPTVGVGDLGLPDAPEQWSLEDGGFISDQVVGGQSVGGMTHNQGITKVSPWWTVIADKTFDPTAQFSTATNCRVHVRWFKAYSRNRSTKAWTLRSEKADAFYTPEGVLAILDYQYPSGNQLGAISSARLASGASGGTMCRMINDWCLHGWVLPMHRHSVTTEDCFGVQVQMRLVPTNPQLAWDWPSFRVNGVCGGDNFADSGALNGFIAEHNHGALKRLTNVWQTFSAADVLREDGSKPNQGSGISQADYLASPMPLPTQEIIWLERGTYTQATNKQTLVLKRSAVTGTNKTYFISQSQGTFTSPISSVVIPAGQASVSFQVDTPMGAVQGQNTIFMTDNADEDHWGTFTIGSGIETGGTGGDSNPDPNRPVDLAFTGVRTTGIDIAAMITAASALPVGQQKQSFSTSLVTKLGVNPALEIRSESEVMYRTRLNSALLVDSTGIITLPEQFVEPPEMRTGNALTAPTTLLALRNVSNPAIEVQMALKVGVSGGTGANLALGATEWGGDSLTRGASGVYYSPVSKFRDLIIGAGGSLSYVGTQVGQSYPGGFNVTATGGWKLVDLQGAATAGAALNPKTIILHIGTNDSWTQDGTAITAKVNACFDAWKNALGGLTNKNFYVCIPIRLSSFTMATYDALVLAMTNWVAANPLAKLINLNDAGLNVSGADGTGDGTHWSESGANKAATLVFNKMNVGSTTGYLLASTALNGTTGLVRAQTVRLFAPVTLDVGAPGGGGPTDPGGTTGMYSKQTLIDDMTLANENNWGLELAPNTRTGTRVYAQRTVTIKRTDGDSGYPNAYLSDGSVKTPYAPSFSKTLTDSTSINLLGWIVVGRAEQQTLRSSNSRFQVRGFKLWAYHRNGTWSTLSSDENGIIGASWHADYAYPGAETFTNIEVGSALYQARVETSTNGGGESLGSIGYGGWGSMPSVRGSTVQKFADFTLHAYPIGYTNNRKWWVDNIRAVLQVCECRMIIHDPTKADDRANAKLMVWSGADWRADGTYLSDGVGVGRLKLVTNEWQIFSWGTVPSSVLTSNPPPGYS